MAETKSAKVSQSFRLVIEHIKADSSSNNRANKSDSAVQGSKYWNFFSQSSVLGSLMNSFNYFLCF